MIKNVFYAAVVLTGLANQTMGEWVYAGGSLPADYPHAHKAYKDDSEMCWAATASNLIEFWQDRYQKETGLTLPQGAPGGLEGDRASRVFDAFVEAYPNVGLGAREGMLWYFGGYDRIPYELQHPGAYWFEYCTTLGYKSDYDSLSRNSYVTSCGLYQPTVENYYSYDTYANAKTFSNAVRAGLESGSLIALSLTDSSAGHAITLYGADFDDNGLVRSVLIHDNNFSSGAYKDPFTCDVKYEEATVKVGDDDGKEGELPAKDIAYMKVQLTNGVPGYLSGHQVTGLDYLSLAIVPEPGAAVLSLAAAVALGMRRRRNA